MKNNYKFFANRECKYFPCHSGANPGQFNCLTCFCPLFAMGKNCGGSFQYSEKGVKSCINCALPHRPEYYDTIIAKLKEWRPGYADA